MIKKLQRKDSRRAVEHGEAARDGRRRVPGVPPPPHRAPEEVPRHLRPGRSARASPATAGASSRRVGRRRETPTSRRVEPSDDGPRGVEARAFLADSAAGVDGSSTT